MAILRKLVTPAVMSIFGVLLNGCAGGHGQSAGYFPCSLLTAQEVAAQINEPVAQVTQLPPDSCRYLGQNPVDFIIVRASETGGQTLFQGTRLGASLIGINKQQQGSAGVGDDSYWAGVNQNVIWVRKGDAYFSINMATAPVDQHAVALKLAQVAVTRL